MSHLATSPQADAQRTAAFRSGIDGQSALRFAPLACRLPIANRARRLAIVALWVFASIAFMPAQAQRATGGAGIYRDHIVWFSWSGGVDGAGIADGVPLVVTNSTPVAGQFLRTTCRLDNASGNRTPPNLITYRPGNWTGDILDDLYFTGLGAGTANTLVVGLTNRTQGGGSAATLATGSGLISCSATFGPTNTPADPVYQLGGLVVADAEQSASAQGENVAMQGGGGTTWRLIERASTCGPSTSSTTYLPGSSLLIFNGSNPTCAPPGAGPAAIAFLDGSTTVSFAFAGGGRSAIAIGVMVFNADLGDAPATYGQALHLSRLNFINGVPPDNTQPGRPPSSGMFSYPLATLFYAPAVRLGTLVDTEVVNQNSPGANLDDAVFQDDEDGIAPPAPITLVPGSTYTLNNVACAGPATVYGYIDFNRDGDFADPNEKSAQSICPTAAPTTIALSWTLPALANLSAGASFMRLRIGQVDGEVSSPTGNASDGEVEDYPITLALVSDLSITKTNTPGLNNEVDQATDSLQSGATTTYTLRATNNGPSTIASAVVRDAPGAGITCPSANTVTITGDGVPVGSFTIGNLTGAGGIVLGTLSAGQTAVLSFTCNVQ